MDDPNVMLTMLRQAIVDQDHEAYAEALEALLVWEHAGGAMPDRPTAASHPDRVATIAALLRQLIETALLIEDELLALLPLLERAGLLRLGHRLTIRLARLIRRTPTPPGHP
jgi:hypothetical protein